MSDEDYQVYNEFELLLLLMTMVTQLRKFIKKLINRFAKIFGVKWHDLVDSRVRWVLFLGLRGKKKKVFVVGLNKTGTSSLGETMRDLGRRHLSYSPLAIRAFNDRDVETLKAIMDGFDSFNDKPWNDPGLWPLMSDRCPEALWVYTFRNVEKWSQSYLNYSQQADAPNEEAFIKSLNAEQFVSQHHGAAKDFEKSNNLSFVWLDCDDLSRGGSAKLSEAMGCEVKIGHHNVTRLNKSN